MFGLYPVYSQYFADLFGIRSLDFGYVTILAIIIGSIYYQLNIQRIVTKPSHSFIVKNIRESLVRISGLNLNANQLKKIKSEKKYMNVFYKILDNNESLKKKTANVYFNGIFWTSTADSFIINLLFYFLYKYLDDSIIGREKLSILFLILAIFSVVLHIISVFKHINLSDEQFHFLETHKKSEVTSEINGIL